MSLADFLESLEQAGELAGISAEVGPDLELSAVSERLAREEGRAVLFERVRGHAPPVVTSVLGSERRICLALHSTSVDEAAERVAAALGTRPDGWMERIRPTAQGSFAPRTVKTGMCQQVVRLGRDVDLAELPAPRAWPQETNPSLTAGVAVCRNRQSGRIAFESFPLERLDRNRLGLHWHAFHQAARNLAAYHAAGEKMPVAVVLGGSPVYRLAAAAALGGLDRLAWAGLLGGKPVEMVKCRTHDLEVPVDADFILEGLVDPAEPEVMSGILAGPDGHYRPPAPVSVMQVSALTHRINPLLPVVVTGAPPHEASTVERAAARLIAPLVRQAIPEIVDYDFPPAAAWPGLAIVSFRKAYAWQARKVAAALWGLDATLFTKLLVLVDEHVNVLDAAQVLAEAVALVDPARDVFFHQGPAWPLDQASIEGSASMTRMAIDATAKLAGERPQATSQRLATSEEIARLVQSRWAEFNPAPASGRRLPG